MSRRLSLPNWEHEGHVRCERALRGLCSTAGFDTWRAILNIARAMDGMIVLSRTAQVKRKRPVGVEETVDDKMPISTKIVRKFGDAPEHVSIEKSPIADPDF